MIPLLLVCLVSTSRALEADKTSWLALTLFEHPNCRGKFVRYDGDMMET